MKKVYLFMLMLIALLLVGFSCQQDETITFKYFRVEVIENGEGYVTDTDGVILFKPDEIILKSNNENPNVRYTILREVSPQVQYRNHRAWLVQHYKYPEAQIVIEISEGEGVKITELSTGSKAFFFAKEVQDAFEPLPEKNIWFHFDKSGNLRAVYRGN